MKLRAHGDKVRAAKWLIAFSSLLLLAGVVLVAVGTSAGYPAYAKSGAKALYSEFGGFVPFFGGVYGNVSFTVLSVYGNGTMFVRIQANVSQSGNAPPQVLNTTTLDKVYSPTQFPGVPAANLSNQNFEFEHTPLNFVRNTVVSVPGGSYNTTEYSGVSPDGNQTFFWFDRPSGLAVEVSKAGAVIQLMSSNVASPVATQSAVELYLPYVLIVAVLWGGLGAVYILVIRRSVRKAEAGRTDKG